MVFTGVWLETITANAQTSDWGSDSTDEILTNYSYNSSGKNVDVVIVDAHINPDHPEFAVNTDGSGGSRVNQFNCFSIIMYWGMVLTELILQHFWCFTKQQSRNARSRTCCGNTHMGKRC